MVSFDNIVRIFLSRPSKTQVCVAFISAAFTSASATRVLLLN